MRLYKCLLYIDLQQSFSLVLLSIVSTMYVSVYCITTYNNLKDFFLSCRYNSIERKGKKMSGFIKKTEVICNAKLVISLYGFKVFCACLVATKGTTFLAILVKYGKL